ncbi:sugar phosphate isomerase/epimerase family protein [Propionispora vibrioides]|uniref:Sugar phosphate isomerase/epimerase n=1 Tax=Propionispora vibrioides TaxID=112903 RepID=A0A1H8Y1K5_9FIRM|nr:sugar phosphate isomerase/epimerase family protein [Propionispora vibrioides]SEP46190.1 Sugar phosphate isomerase/epimerase [Propionispora vibrioides]
MKIGLNSAILADLNFEEVINYASENGFSCVEMMCWPVGKAERRYAGVTHIDVSDMDVEKAGYINSYAKSKKVEISALGYYPNPLDPDKEKRQFYIEHIMKIITAASILGVDTVTTFIGRDKDKTIEENLIIFESVWTPIIQYAEENNVRIAIENCPMLFTNNEWPGGLNLATTPRIWRKMFELIPNANFGLNYDPSHFVWQQMDYIKPIYEFKDRIFHVHIKDIKVYKDKLDDVGIMAVPLQYISPKLPGLGDVNWGKYISALTDIKYKGAVCLEIEDKTFEDSLESIKKAITISRNYTNQFLL